MPSFLRNLLILLTLSLLLANCAKWKLNPYDLVPQVKTGSASASATTSVQVEARIETLGPNSLQEFGIVYSASNQQPTVTDTKIVATGTSGSAQVMLNGLQPNMTYYYRTYAINDKGLIGYGEVQSFKTATVIADVRTLDLVGSPGATSIQVQVQVANSSAVTVKEFGIVYSPTSQTPTTSDSKATATGTGATTPVSLTNLQANTTYYYRAYAITDAGTVSYGETKSVKTGELLPIAETRDVVGTPASTSALVSVGVTNASQVTLKEYGVVYSPTSQTPTLSDSKVTATGVTGASTTLTIASLQPGTTYYYRAYATSGAGTTTYGAVKSLQTAALAVAQKPDVETTDAVDVTSVKANLVMKIKAAPTQVEKFGICFSKTNNDPKPDNGVSVMTNKDPTYNLNALYAFGTDVYSLPLEANTTYYYRGYATTVAVNGKTETGLGEVKTFKTAALSNSLVIFGSKDKKVYALNATTGAKQWDFITNGGGVGGLDAVNSSATFANGTVFVGDFAGYLYAIDAQTGARKWGRLSSGNRFESSPVIGNGLLYIGSNEKWVSAFDIANGDAKWRYSTGDKVISSPAFVDNVVYVGCNDAKVYAINSTNGTLKWSYATGGYILSSPTVVNSVVYIGSSDKKLYALNTATGTLKWAATLPSLVNSCPIVAGNSVYVGCDDKSLYALNATTGAILWKSAATGSFVGGSPTVSNGLVYVGSGDNKIYAFDAATGATKWTFATNNETYASPVIANGLLYMGSQDGKMYCLDALTGAKKWEFVTGDQIYATPLVLQDGAVVGAYPAISGITN
ncbi:outer membrane protein assembly factor BamB family protein [Spirosoma agri]|uniref:PQQ-binding-like beta-propeller repeat protein n=1 Tax=Spirosoma agri TaxID=1987381 RepID=A0A6M0IMX3_9BACT|nr:PQQ-binding-like beta-propeller repeat protein [Spirosoma agri]NEU69676.1 PQQ-binding-like beta-propeller repeat protein [Spirosoma agri]